MIWRLFARHLMSGSRFPWDVYKRQPSPRPQPANKTKHFICFHLRNSQFTNDFSLISIAYKSTYINAFFVVNQRPFYEYRSVLPVYLPPYGVMPLAYMEKIFSSMVSLPKGMYGYQSQWTAVCCTSLMRIMGTESGMGTSLSGYFRVMSFFSFAKQKVNIVLHLWELQQFVAKRNQARGLFGVTLPKGFKFFFPNLGCQRFVAQLCRKMFGSYQSAGILKFRFYQHLQFPMPQKAETCFMLNKRRSRDDTSRQN